MAKTNGRRWEEAEEQLLGMGKSLGATVTVHDYQGRTQLTNMAATSLTMLACGVCWEGGIPPAD